MQKGNPVQLEIFSHPEGESVRAVSSKKIWLSILLHEKIILYTIILLVASIVSFSLGIKRGREFSLSRQYQIPQLPTQLMQKDNPPVKEKIATEQKEIKPVTPAGLPSKEDAGYTIQVASYKTRTYAQKEANKLNKKGLGTLILPKGDYIILCVGKFVNKNQAYPALNELKKTYQGCFVRRL